MSASSRPGILAALLPSGLPPTPLIQTAQWGWHTLWQLMMAQLAPGTKEGAYQRPDSQLRQWVEAAEDATFPGVANRYTLLVGVSCPWAHRTVLVRTLKGLEAAIATETLEADPSVGGWRFRSPMLGCQTLKEFYRLTSPNYSGRSTVPALWDSETQQIVNNESADLIVMLNSAFNAVASFPQVDLYPEALRPVIDDWNAKIYTAINNGVYRCGFSRSQAAYDEAAQSLFAMLDQVDHALAGQRYLCGAELTLADIRLFTTLIRFDLVYYNLFRCNFKRIQDYPHLGPYLRDLYQLPGVGENCDLEGIKQGYYKSLFPLNPGGIVPKGPDLGYLMG